MQAARRSRRRVQTVRIYFRDDGIDPPEVYEWGDPEASYEMKTYYFGEVDDALVERFRAAKKWLSAARDELEKAYREAIAPQCEKDREEYARKHGRPPPVHTGSVVRMNDGRAQPTIDTASQIKTWVDAKTSVEELKRRLSSAETDLMNATNNLGKFLCPPDAKVGEKFRIWYGDGLLVVEKHDAANIYRISWRKLSWASRDGRS